MIHALAVVVQEIQKFEVSGNKAGDTTVIRRVSSSSSSSVSGALSVFYTTFYAVLWFPNALKHPISRGQTSAKKMIEKSLIKEHP